jgi:hypothetical protein
MIQIGSLVAVILKTRESIATLLVYCPMIPDTLISLASVVNIPYLSNLNEEVWFDCKGVR